MGQMGKKNKRAWWVWDNRHLSLRGRSNFDLWWKWSHQEFDLAGFDTGVVGVETGKDVQKMLAQER